MLQLSDLEKAEVQAASHTGDEFDLVIQYRKGKCMLVLRRWKGDWYRAIALFELKDKSKFEEYKDLIYALLRSRKRKIASD